MASQQVSALLAATLEADASTRSRAEAQLGTLVTNDGTLGASLAHAMADASSCPLAIRQAAALLLHQVVRKTWSPINGAFQGVDGQAMPLEAKAAVRRALVDVLLGSERKLRLACAHTLATVASTDFPDHMPELLPRLVGALQPFTQPGTTADPDPAHGALVFLSEFARSELDEQQLLRLTNELLPSLEAIVSAPIDAHLRARAVGLVRQMIETTYMVREQYPESAQQALVTVLPRWIPALLSLIEEGKQGVAFLAANPPAEQLEPWLHLALTSEALHTLKLASHVKPVFKTHVATVVVAATQLASHAATAVEVYETAPDAPGEPADFPPEGDSDIASSLAGVASAATELVGALLRSYHKSVSNVFQSVPPNSAEGTQSVLATLVESLASLAQVTQDQEEEWSSNINAFVAELDEADGGGALFAGSESLRANGLESISELLEALPGPTIAALQRTVHARAAVSQSYQQQGRDDWWKALEATLVLLGGNGDLLSELLPSHPFDLERVFEAVVVPHVGPGTPRFLRAQTFLFASQLAAVLPPHISLQFLAAASETLGTNDGIAVAAATRTVRNFYRHFNSVPPPPEARTTYAAPILSALGTLLQSTTQVALASPAGSAEADTSVLVLEAVQAVAVLALGSETEPSVVPLDALGQVAHVVVEAFLAQRDDPVIGAVVEDVLEALVGRVAAPGDAAVLATSLPLLSAHVLSPTTAEVEAEGSVQAATSDDLGRWATRAAATMSCIDALLRPAQPEALLDSRVNAATHVLPALIGAWLALGTDREVQQALVRSLTFLVGKAPGPTLGWTGTPHMRSEPSSTQEFLGTVLSALLDPSDEMETAGLALGPLLCALVRRETRLTATTRETDELLRALVTRLASCKTAALAHGILVPLLFLIAGPNAGASTSGDTLAHLASLVVGDSTALVLVTQRWLQEASAVHGVWARKVNAMALMTLLAYSGPGNDLLLTLPVQGDEVIQSSDPTKIVTRSMTRKTAPTYRSVPLGVGALTALLDEWDSALAKGAEAEADPASAGDGDDDGWGDEDEDELLGTGLNVSDLLDLGMMDDATTVDPASAMGKAEWAADTVAHLDLSTWIPMHLSQLRPVLERWEASVPGFLGQLSTKHQELLHKVIV